MSASIICPQCRASLRITSLPALGKTLKCPKCQSAFRYQPDAAAAATASAPPAAGAAKPAPGSGMGAWLAFAAVTCLVLLIACGAAW